MSSWDMTPPMDGDFLQEIDVISGIRQIERGLHSGDSAAHDHYRTRDVLGHIVPLLAGVNVILTHISYSYAIVCFVPREDNVNHGFRNCQLFLRIVTHPCRLDSPSFWLTGSFPSPASTGPSSAGTTRKRTVFITSETSRSTLMRHGYTVFHTHVAWGAGVDRRARDLRNEILHITDGFRRWPRVHIIAHSMGGLDARRMLFTYRMEQHIASLTTIATPHRGTSYADWGIRHFRFLIPLCRVFGLHIEGVLDLTRPSCLRFNEVTAAYEAGNGVVYRTVAGIQPTERIFLPMRFSHGIILREEGENDGLVPLESAVWRPEVHLKTIHADHLNQIGWWHPGVKKAGISRRAFEAEIGRFYLDLAAGLAD